MRGKLPLSAEGRREVVMQIEQALEQGFSQNSSERLVGRMQHLLGIERPMVPLIHPAVALAIALQIAGISSTDEVTAPTLAKSTSLLALSAGRVRLSLVDSDTLTWNLSETALQRLISQRHREGRPLPRAIVVAHNYGMPAQLETLMGLARTHGMIVIEEASDALGSHYLNHPCGTIGDYAIVGLDAFSGEWSDSGALLVCPNEARARRARELAERTFREGDLLVRRSYETPSLLSSEASFWANIHLDGWEESLSLVRRNHQLLCSLLAPAMGIRPLEAPSEGYQINGFCTPILIDSSLLHFSAGELLLALQAEGIEAQPMRRPLHKLAMFEGAEFYPTGVADQYTTAGLVLPSGAHITEKEVEYIASFIRSFIIRYN